jgi:hypothetical protein
MRSDTKWVIFRPIEGKIDKETAPDAENSANGDVEYIIIAGHEGALYVTKYTGEKAGRRIQATKGSQGTENFHGQLNSNFERANITIDQAIEGVIRVFNSWVWKKSDSLPKNIHPREETAKGLNLKDNKATFEGNQSSRFDSMETHLNKMKTDYGSGS